MMMMRSCCKLKWMTGWIAWCMIIIWGVDASRHKGSHILLYEELISNYGPTSQRPVLDNHQHMDVGVELKIQQVIELNEREQTLQISAYMYLTWHDDYLGWNTTEYPDVPFMIIPSSAIWRPDIHLYQNVDRNFENVKDFGVYLAPNGSIIWSTAVIYTTTCRIDARLFPFDTQGCKLRFGSYLYDMTLMSMSYREDTTSSSSRYYIQNGIWELIDVQPTNQIIKYHVYGDEIPYSEVVITIYLKRRPLFHILSFILPCGLLSGLNILVFILPTVSGEKVSLGITNLLALVLFQQLIADSLPPASDNMPIISYYFTPMLFVGCLSITSGVAVAALYHQDKSRTVPPWLRKITALFSSSPPPVANPETRLKEYHHQGDISTSASVIPESDQFTLRSDPDLSACPTGEHTNSLDDCQDSVGRNLGDAGFNPEWEHVASVVDRLSLAVGTVITVMAILATVIMFLVTNANIDS